MPPVHAAVMLGATAGRGGVEGDAMVWRGAVRTAYAGSLANDQEIGLAGHGAGHVTSQAFDYRLDARLAKVEPPATSDLGEHPSDHT